MKLSGKALIVIGLVLIGAVGLTGWWWLKMRGQPAHAIASQGGKNMNLRVEVPVYLAQADPRWAEETIGGSDEKFASVGCTLCSLCMAISTLSGEPIDPIELNEALKQLKGYTPDGWIIWDVVSNAVPGVSIEVVHQASHSGLDGALEGGKLPLVKFWLPGGIPHWVAMVGKEGQDYLVLDPLSGSEPLALSARTDEIQAVRIVSWK